MKNKQQVNVETDEEQSIDDFDFVDFESRTVKRMNWFAKEILECRNICRPKVLSRKHFEELELKKRTKSVHLDKQMKIEIGHADSTRTTNQSPKTSFLTRLFQSGRSSK